MTIKHQIVRLLFCIEVAVVMGFYFFGAQGIMALMQQKQELKQHQATSRALEQDIKNFEYDYDAWKNDPFYVEKHAREKLAMAREGEKIYVIK